MGEEVQKILTNILNKMQEASDNIVCQTKGDAPYDATMGEEIIKAYSECVYFEHMCDYCLDFENATNDIQKRQGLLDVSLVSEEKEYDDFVSLMETRIIRKSFDITKVGRDYWPADIKFYHLFKDLYEYATIVLVQETFLNGRPLFGNIVNMEKGLQYFDKIIVRMKKEIARREENKCYFVIAGRKYGPLARDRVDGMINTIKGGIETCEEEKQAAEIRDTMCVLEVGSKKYGPFWCRDVEDMILDKNCIIPCREDDNEDVPNNEKDNQIENILEDFVEDFVDEEIAAKYKLDVDKQFGTLIEKVMGFDDVDEDRLAIIAAKMKVWLD